MISSCGDDESKISFFGNTVQGMVGRNSLHSNSDHMMPAGPVVHIQAESCRSGVSNLAGDPWGDIWVGVLVEGMAVRDPLVEQLPCNNQGDNWVHMSEGKDLPRNLPVGWGVE